MPKEQYMCQLCANHGIFNQPKKGHKQKCPFRECPCSLCSLNTKRRALDQIERQLKHTDNVPQLDSVPCLDTAQDEYTINGQHNGSHLHNTLPSPSFQTHSISPNNAPSTPTVFTNRRSPHSSTSSSNVFCVALPATITKKDLKRSIMMRGEYTNNMGKKPKRIDEAIENIHRQKSIFHSAEMLAN